MMSIMAKNYKLSNLENGPSKACSNHYHHPTRVWRAAKVNRGDVLAPLCFFLPNHKIYPLFTIQDNLPITPISTPSSKQRPERAQNFAKSFD